MDIEKVDGMFVQVCMMCVFVSVCLFVAFVVSFEGVVYMCAHVLHCMPKNAC